MRCAVRRDVPVATKMRDEQFPANGWLRKLANTDSWMSEFGNCFWQQSDPNPLSDQIDDRLKIGNVEIGPPLEPGLAECAVDQGAGPPAHLEVDERILDQRAERHVVVPGQGMIGRRLF